MYYAFCCHTIDHPSIHNRPFGHLCSGQINQIDLLHLLRFLTLFSLRKYICERRFPAFFVKVIILNGETGTGKTFNAWKALEFLTRSVSPEGSPQSGDILRRISDACRLISAFTTAPTEKNKVSSRHVQLVWLEYKMGLMCGATISSYLLERDRVTKGCCNFQIFGQVKEVLISHMYSKKYVRWPNLFAKLREMHFRWWLR